MSLTTSLPRTRRLAGAALGAAAVATVIWAPLAGAETRPGGIVDLVDRVSPAVVTVLATPEERTASAPGTPPFAPGSPFEEFFRQFGLPHGLPMPEEPGRGPQGVSLGSGFLIEADGYIVTNNHVVEDAAEITIRMADEREFDAEVIGTDPKTDLALLKVEGDDLPFLALGDSDALRVGEDVIAVGNPFGLGGTVTRGIVSAIGRDIATGPYTEFIQTDAAINRGNSGGPLLNLEGEVIGVNTQIYSPTGGSVGVGFAIPSNLVEAVVAELREDGSVERGWLGVSIQPVTPGIAEALGLDGTDGALVADVLAGSPADGTLESGDVIVGFAGRTVASMRELPRLVAAEQPGETVAVEILRNGREETVELTLGELEAERRAEAAAPAPAGETASDRLGASVATLTPAIRAELGLDDAVEGVVVTGLEPGGRAAEAGVRVGDVILTVAGTEVEAPADIERAIAEAPADAVLLKVARGDARVFIGIPLA